jgi:hypothetical protein
LIDPEDWRRRVAHPLRTPFALYGQKVLVALNEVGVGYDVPWPAGFDRYH